MQGTLSWWFGFEPLVLVEGKRETTPNHQITNPNHQSKPSIRVKLKHAVGLPATYCLRLPHDPGESQDTDFCHESSHEDHENCSRRPRESPFKALTRWVHFSLGYSGCYLRGLCSPHWEDWRGQEGLVLWYLAGRGSRWLVYRPETADMTREMEPCSEGYPSVSLSKVAQG